MVLKGLLGQEVFKGKLDLVEVRVLKDLPGPVEVWVLKGLLGQREQVVLRVKLVRLVWGVWVILDLREQLDQQGQVVLRERLDRRG